MSKSEKFKTFELTLKDGSKVITKAPTAKLTVEYATKLAYHWVKVDKEDVISIVGIK